MEQKFKTQLVAKGPKGAWTHMPIPFNVHEVFGSKSQVKVAGTLNGVPFRNSIMPIGDGTHYMNIRKELKEAAQVQAGDTVEVTLAEDRGERKVDLTEEMRQALSANPEAGARFASLPYSHQKEYLDWITSAKKPETRTARIAKAIEKLAAGKQFS